MSESVSSNMSASFELLTSPAPPPHPFENELILEAVLKKCEPEDLNECRLVSKHWYAVSLPVWRNGPRIHLKDSVKPPEEQQSSSSSSMAKFLQDVKKNKKGLANSADSASSTYEFGGISQYKNFEITSDGGPSSWTLEESFWSVCGGWISELYFCEFKFQDLQTFKKLVGCSFTPSLKSLTIYRAEFGFEVMVPMEDDHELESADKSQNLSEMNVNVHLKSLSVVDTSKLPISWIELLRCFPYLENLELANLDDEYDWKREATKMFDAITKIRRMDNKKRMPLKSLKMSMSTLGTDSGYGRTLAAFPLLESFLKNNQLYLKTLKLFLRADTPVSALYGTLAHQSKSLKSFSLDGGDLADFRLPTTMRVLETLKLWASAAEPINLDFLKQCPKLEVLEIRFARDRLDSISIIQNTSKVLMDGVVMPYLTNFQCNYRSADYSSEDIARLRQWMPNLKILRLKLSNEQFRMVVKLWPALEDLFLCHYSTVDDEGITGIPAGWEKLGIRLYPNLTDLKSLRCLGTYAAHGEDTSDTDSESDVWNSVYGTHFTDKSVIYGFLQMESLRSLYFQANTLTSEALNLLKDKISDLDVLYNRLI